MASLYRGQSNALCKMPVELLWDIADKLERADHNNLSRTCRFLTFALQGSLFKKGNHVAVLYGSIHSKIPVLQRALHFDYPIDNDLYDDRSALAMASEFGQPQAVSYLLQEGASVDRQDQDGHTALTYAFGALREKHANDASSVAEVILMLLRAGGNVNCVMPVYIPGNGAVLVVEAALKGAIGVEQTRALLEMFADRGLDMNVANFWGNSPLQYATKMYAECRGLIDYLLDHGADVNFGADQGRDGNRYTALGQAIIDNNVDAMNHLIARDANTGPGPATALSLLFVAIERSNPTPGPVITLLRHGANPNALETVAPPNRMFPPTPLTVAAIQAAKAGHVTEILAALLAAGADPNLPDAGGSHTLHHILADPVQGTPVILECLLAHGADATIPRSHPPRSSTLPFFAIAVYRKRLSASERMVLKPSFSAYRNKVVELLIRAGADVNQSSTPLKDLSLPLELALSIAYPSEPESFYQTEYSFGCRPESTQSKPQFLSGPALDLYILQKIFAQEVARLGQPIESASVVLGPNHAMAEHQWGDELIGTLLRAGAAVTQKILANAYKKLKNRNAATFLNEDDFRDC